MREILFRGKKYNGEWAHGYYVQANNSWHGHGKHKEWIVCSACANGGRFALQEKHAVIPETVGQYTGLTDKNGKKIFEGDVVDILTENEEVGIVTYDEGCFYVKADGFSVDFRNNINGNDLLVIGNIHDNPEILKREFYICRKRD